MYKRLRELREDAEYTQQQVARYLHCSQQSYSYYELGLREIPISLLVRLSQLYHTSTDDLLGLTPKETRKEREVEP